MLSVEILKKKKKRRRATESGALRSLDHQFDDQIVVLVKKVSKFKLIQLNFHQVEKREFQN